MSHDVQYPKPFPGALGTSMTKQREVSTLTLKKGKERQETKNHSHTKTRQAPDLLFLLTYLNYSSSLVFVTVSGKWNRQSKYQSNT